ncbi:uncharacterized protein LY89DRAFT_707936 [Mollisia scopiformis]|uniref:MYND-type domain-containing protein n=1 Tax=Mollisia scopiformis TaxID=149040 RepID=A0A194X6I8_MOLSC|nr:uncharacterized protein LY89DRAFT_707936 [Mollisia scopiformis]KUJ15801.1 hypothetical protein LY89DRAFT_707936 [Mollisia scopiformis]
MHVVPYCGYEYYWRFPRDIESEIATLAAWRHVKQQQREPLSSDKHDEDDLSEDEDQGGHEGEDNDWKKGFLDRLAEILCYSKEPSLITSAALIYSDGGATIVATRNSSLKNNTWSDKDIKMLEGLAELLERVSSNDKFEAHLLPALQKALVIYYRQRIQHHAKAVMSLEKDTGIKFLEEDKWSAVTSGQFNVDEFAEHVEYLSYSTEFYSRLETNLEPKKLTRAMQYAIAFLRVAQQCSGFRNVKIVLLESLPPRKVDIWQLPAGQFPVTPKQDYRFKEEVKKSKNVHAEMMLMTYLLSSRAPGSDAFPYLGISKKTCLLCGHILQEMDYFETRGNHGKVYSQWTLPSTLRTSIEVANNLDKAVQRLRDILLTRDDVPYRSAEKESVMAAPLQPNYGKTATLFNRVVHDPRFLAREAEWLSLRFKKEADNEDLVPTDAPWDNASMPMINTEYPEDAKGENAHPTACAFCNDTCRLTHFCEKCRLTAYCDLDCYRSDWYRHKFSCNSGRPIDATDYLVLACHLNEFPKEDDVAKQYGFMYFASGKDRSRLFNLYHRLVIDWGIDGDELRSSVEGNNLKEMLVSRCSQDPVMHTDMLWLEKEEGFGANSEGPGLIVLFEKARDELLSPNDRTLPLFELQPREKRDALIFYAQLRNGFKPVLDEDNWISFGFCTAADPALEQQLASAYVPLVEQCPFDDFWKAMVESRIVDMFSKYGLSDQISHMRNFKDFMATVMVDYGFTNCDNVGQRMQLQEMYKDYFRRGEDEMKLHEACINGNLATFLTSVFGSLEVSPHLLRNPYPLKNCPLAGMVAEYVIACPESALDQIKALKGDDWQDAMIFTIPDCEDDPMVRQIYNRAAFLGTGLGKRSYPGTDGNIIAELTIE